MVYSKERRLEVLADCDAGMTTHEVALKYKVCKSWVRRVKQERRELGKVAPATKRKRKPLWEPYTDQIIELVRNQSDLTLDELSAKLNHAVHRVSLCRALQKLRLTLKKSPQSSRTRSTGRQSKASRASRSPTRA
jgi:transposase